VQFHLPLRRVAIDRRVIAALPKARRLVNPPFASVWDLPAA